MKREDELALITRAKANSDPRTTTLGAKESLSSVERYTDPQRFNLELQSIFRVQPIACLHSSELPVPNCFKTMSTHLGNVVFTRDDDGQAHAFYNACRHRGAKVANKDSGCSKRLSCPYHAWSYNTKGELLIIPDGNESFPNIDKSTMGLKAIPCTERFGFIWLCPKATDNQAAAQALSNHLGPASADLEWLDIDKLHLFKRSSKRWKCNWKIVSEGGLETYHFKFAHKNTIGPHFLHNSCVYDPLGDHARVVMTTETVKHLEDTAPSQWRLRDIAHIVYGIFPETTLLVQKEHIDWIRMIPVSPDETDIEITSLIPKPEAELNDAERSHWQRNMDISVATLDEDFELGEAIQSNMRTGANDHLTFGRNESALRNFNEVVDRACGIARQA